jgi:putative FmdB family regulatory protein
VPTYSYACTACEHRFDTVQKFTDSSLTDCPECSGRLRKLFSAVGIVFKGSGFYRTDSRSGGPSHEGQSSSNGKSESGGANGKSESGGDKKSEPGANGKSTAETKPAKSGSTGSKSGSGSGSSASSSTTAAAS